MIDDPSDLLNPDNLLFSSISNGTISINNLLESCFILCSQTLYLTYFSLISNPEKAHKECRGKVSSPVRLGIGKKGLFSGQLLRWNYSPRAVPFLRGEVHLSHVVLHKTNEIHRSSEPGTSRTHHLVYQGKVDSGSNHMKEVSLIQTVQKHNGGLFPPVSFGHFSCFSSVCKGCCILFLLLFECRQF